jgi:hypothetical protein
MNQGAFLMKGLDNVRRRVYHAGKIPIRGIAPGGWS